jgi:hypothetical protein
VSVRKALFKPDSGEIGGRMNDTHFRNKRSIAVMGSDGFDWDTTVSVLER